MPPKKFQQAILEWFDHHGRRDLPWQQQINPYRVWLSEIMLQQTQVSTVIPYYNRFIQHYPDVKQLAAAPIDSVLQLWAGLGYYARARNLHQTAKLISDNDGQFPNDFSLLMQLPGIGRSTAGAILSIAFNNSHPILDGNVRRVLARFYAISGWTGGAKVSKQLWQLSEQYTPIERVADYTQAMMDLGATLCTRSMPKCNDCPIQIHCIAYKENKVNQIPTPKPSKIIPVKQIFFLVLSNKQNQYFLLKRPATGIWGGLWSFPEFNSMAEIEAWCLENKLPINSINQQEQQRHTFSHYHLDYNTVLIATENANDKVMEENQSDWYNIEQISQLGLPAPIKKIMMM